MAKVSLHTSAPDGATAPQQSRSGGVLRRLTVTPGGNLEGSVQRILADREGKKTWGELERLEEKAAVSPAAARALTRLEALNASREYVGKERKKGQPTEVATLIERSDLKTQQEAWRHVIDGSSRSQCLAALKASRHGSGWKELGLPPCFDKQVGPVGSVSLEDPERVSQLLNEALKRRLNPDSEDRRLDEYRRLYHAYNKVRTGKLQGQVSERSLYLDLKSLEDKILPEHLARAKKDVKGQLLGGTEFDRLHPQSRMRRFLGTLSALPPASRERHIFRELSDVAVRDPRELKRYANLVQQEIRRCPGRLRTELMPRFHQALAQVTRTHGEKLQAEGANSPALGDFRELLRALTGEDPTQGQAKKDDGLELYRSGLTYNGSVKNYTYS